MSRGSRWDVARARGIRPGWVDREGDALTAAAEALVARILAVPWSLRPGGPDPGWDMEYRGWRIDVKHTRHIDGYLAVKVWKPGHADVYVLVTGPTADNLEVRGWAWRSEVEAAPIRDYGYRNPDGSPQEIYALRQDRLWDIDLLMLNPAEWESE